MTVRELECPAAPITQSPPPREGVRRIHRERCVLREPFLETVRRFAHLPGTVALMSGGDHDCARHHILGVFPWLCLRSKSTAVEITKQGDTLRSHQDPFEVLAQLLAQYRLASVDETMPLQAGLLGYLAYDLKDCLEELPRTSVDDLGLPDLYMVAPGLLLVQAKQTGEAALFVPEFHGEPAGATQRTLARFESLLERPPPARSTHGAASESAASAAFASGFSRAEYMQAVEAIRHYIAQGDVYQVNMSQRFAGDFEGDPFELYAEMYQANPAAFFAYINAGDHQVVSTSPERFIRLDGGLVETRPIKGTRPRGASIDEDSQLREELEGSKKDEAELSMIVDLLRNDIGKVCRAGSVRVSAHKRVESYKNVHHLVSVVEGALDAGKSAVDLIRATFPGGSITGCPKIRSMEIIDELEPVRRHVYTGSIGYISFHGSLDLSIAIRTATIQGGQLVFSVGGGITYDSDPTLEYEETLHKGRTLMKALAGPEPRAEQAASPAGALAWQDGRFAPLERLSVPVVSEGFQYGYGFFETLRVERGRPILLGAHVDRFARAWRRYFVAPPPEVGWRDVIDQLIAANGLEAELAAVKILAAAGRASAPRFDGTLLVTARAYEPPAALTAGFSLLTYPERRHTPLAAHKTMNHMFYKVAGDWAKQQGADAALILNADGTASETNAANLFCTVGDTLYTPASTHVLPGVMAASVRQLLARWGRRVEEQAFSLNELKRADQVFLTNSLLGAAPVTHIDHRPIPSSSALCERINREVFG